MKLKEFKERLDDICENAGFPLIELAMLMEEHDEGEDYKAALKKIKAYVFMDMTRIDPETKEEVETIRRLIPPHVYAERKR